MEYWILLMILIPLSAVIANTIMNRRFEKNWRLRATELGLESSGALPDLSMAGTWKGFEVRIKYHVEYRAKQSPIIYHVISARLQPADVPPAPIFDGATVRNDWFEVKRDGELELAEISNLLDRAINTARHLAEKGSAK